MPPVKPKIGLDFRPIRLKYLQVIQVALKRQIQAIPTDSRKRK
jgi:hypothetical protein